MVQNNKVLTVSYGTFSCTLEGFEDSFDTMKAIAEYFRDLASDDRYFGAEPPQPDADMLARIAQKEIDRQVEARTSEGAVHLRAAEPVEPTPAPPAVAAPVVTPAPAAPAAQAEAPAIEAEPVAAQPVDEAKVAAPVEAPAVEETPEVAQETPAEIVEDVLESAEPVAAEEKTVETVAEVESQPEPQVDEPAIDEPVETVDLAAVAAAVAEPAEAPVADLPPVEDLTAEVEVAEEPDAEEDAIPAADSIAAKLQRIRAVVAQAPQDDEFSEDQHADNFVKESAVDIAAAMRLDDEAELAEEDDQDIQDQTEIAEALERIDQRQLETEADQYAAETEIASQPETEATAEPQVDEQEPTDTEVSESSDDSSLFEDLEDDTADSDGEKLETEANILAEVAAQTAPAEPEAKVQPAKPVGRARIMRVKRSQIEAAVQTGALQEITEEDAPEKAPKGAPKTSLTDVEEADLLKELAAVEAELLASDQAAETASEPEETPEAETAEEPRKPAVVRTAPPTVDSDVSRLMDAADEKLDDPELSSSRETYDHLRAAMAAAQADRAAGGTAGSGNADDPYREDLASVVRPRRPAPTKKVSQRPSPASRPAPLKLVAEQRIDEAPTKSSGPIRPRRIAATQDSEADFSQNGQEGGFAKYASESGAIELSELLEAAASYMSFVEGRDHFSRPQLMNKVKLLNSAEFNREDGLRSFGQLLREGKIEKTNSGHFTASGEIGFRPDERVAG